MSWLHPAVASAKRNHVDDIFFFFCRRCSSQLESCRKTWAMLVSHRPAVNHRVSTILAGLLTLTPYHDGCWAAGRPRPHFGNYLPRVYAQLFFCCLLVISSSIRKTFSRARVEERGLFFFLYFCCVLTAECLDGHGRMTSRRIQPSHTHGSSWWCLCLRHLFSMEEKSQPPSKSIFSYSV